MKKVLVAAALVGIISFAGFSMVKAHGNYGAWHGKGYGACDGCGYSDSLSSNGQDEEKMTSFLEETKETRKEIAVKKSERRALMKQDNPDEKRVAELTGEIYDLKSLLNAKAKETFGEYPSFGPRRAKGRSGNCDRRPRHL